MQNAGWYYVVVVVPRNRRAALSVLAVVLFLLGASSASAQSVDRDLVTGESGGEVQSPESPIAFRLIWVFDASSGPSGQNPTATVRLDIDGRLGRATIATWDVTCVSVAGRQATIGGVAMATPTPLLPANALFYVEDGVGGAPDRAGFETAPTVPPTCPVPPCDETKTDASLTGELTVHDAVAVPTEPRQCFGGGWRSYGFESLGKCLAFVFKARLCEFLEERFGHVPKFCPPTPPASARPAP
jgi:hypothetical protein